MVYDIRPPGPQKFYKYVNIFPRPFRASRTSFVRSSTHYRHGGARSSWVLTDITHTPQVCTCIEFASAPAPDTRRGRRHVLFPDMVDSDALRHIRSYVHPFICVRIRIRPRTSIIHVRVHTSTSVLDPCISVHTSCT